MLVNIKNDLFDVMNRLKEFDDHYFIVYNEKARCYEIHNDENTRSRAGREDVPTSETYALRVPYDELDSRTVELVRKTRVENADRLFAEMDEQNRRADADTVKAAAETLREAQKINTKP